MNFNDFEYQRPDYDLVKSKLLNLMDALKNSTETNEQIKLINEINDVRNNISSMSSIANIRHTINTEDKFYDTENEYWDEVSPLYQELDSLFYEVMVNHNNKDNLIKEFGTQFFKLMENSLKVFSSEIIEDLQEENKEVSKYVKLLASAKILFDGKERNLSGMTPYLVSKDRVIRKAAQEAKSTFFINNEKQFDEIFDKLVKIRVKIAKKLGFNNFIELGYLRMNRIDYNDKMVDNFRKQVIESVVPLASTLYEKQKNRLGLDTLKYYDEKFEFNNGNATPKGDANWIIEQGKKMYHELSPETGEFIDFMIENNLMDLITKKGKAGGGYCTFIPDYKSPFIFSNFNGTSGDIDVLTHEAGHAFQVYRSSWIKIPELLWATYESSEIHSMSMEFFTWKWMEDFFKEDAQKYRFSHLSGAIKFIPYGVLVDHFQHKIYENPDLTPNERKKVWRELEKQYKPHSDYSENPFLERGGWWFQQAHIFEIPFYYIDYTLAQICALQFWKKMSENFEDAWKDYLTLCHEGGTKSFLNLLNVARLKSPFEDGCVEEIMDVVEKNLNKFSI
ncbi:M3 family oligoendopeptidase [Candidatus Cetobacterium colombiensis]|uniref:M3 family oligoendopeptidase n=1 Tax=Candidatus Cetobacterium colombiensis TaxID=3073100 RepID=A0ABU4W6Y6_9FUSO|nr:M3 family oligoendopeptidase [Candidatus Cetobacterium colombiensis]MDX8334999.1 M3 family oligoendopeptidase [Candidatus Cetobacterium colombiensis]